MGNFYTDVIQQDPRFNEPSPCHDMNMLEPTFRDQVVAFMAASKAAGTELRVTETYRSSELQMQYYSEGKTQLRTVGVHHYGLACDFAKIINGQLSWDGDWDFCVDLAKQVSTNTRPVISGIDWGRPDISHSFIDSDHIQGCTIAQQTGLFNGSWYPSAAGASTTSQTPVITPSISSSLTANQAAALAAFDAVNAASFKNWFKRSAFMAFCETESGFDPKSFRQEPSGVASYGLMQVLDSTAQGLGLQGDASQMYDPKIGIFYGLRYATQGWNYLTAHGGVTQDKWVGGYNMGYGAAAQGRSDLHYTTVWYANQKKWAYLDGASIAVPVPQPQPAKPKDDGGEDITFSSAKDLQLCLRDSGDYTGEIDGIIGGGTIDALKAFCARNA